MAAKTYDYIVTIKPSKNHEAFNWITQLLLFIAVLIIGYSFYKNSYNNWSLLGGIVFTGLIVSGWIYSRLTGAGYRFSLLWSGVCLLLFVKMWIGIAYIILALLEKQIKFKQELGVDEDGVTFNSFPKKMYHWNQISNVVLKDGLITLDLNNNRIFQKELDNDTTLEMESEFNEFCRSHIHSSAVPVS